MPKIEQLTTDNFRILAYLCEIKGKEDKVSITQQEIADKFSLSRATVNKIIGELKSEGYIEQDGAHLGRYIIRQEATQLVRTLLQFDNKQKY